MVFIDVSALAAVPYEPTTLRPRRSHDLMWVTTFPIADVQLRMPQILVTSKSNPSPAQICESLLLSYLLFLRLHHCHCQKNLLFYDFIIVTVRKIIFFRSPLTIDQISNIYHMVNWFWIFLVDYNIFSSSITSELLFFYETIIHLNF